MNTSSPSLALAKAIQALEGGRCSDMARALRISHNAVWKWKQQGRLPVRRCLEVERITGVSRYELRPDIYPQPTQDRAA